MAWLVYTTLVIVLIGLGYLLTRLNNENAGCGCLAIVLIIAILYTLLEKFVIPVVLLMHN